MSAYPRDVVTVQRAQQIVGRRARRSSSWAALGACAVLGLAACGGSDPAPAVTSTAPSSPAATSAEPTPAETASTEVPSDASPFSGKAGGAGKPVLVVKYDNTTFAQPHTGLKHADIVYVEEVEWGLTRLAAVFSTTQPTSVGPVRSARVSDIDLLAQFGKPAFAYSGSQHKLMPLLAKASIYDVSGDKGPTGYYRDRSRRAPYDLFARPASLLKRAPKASLGQDIGFTFSDELPTGGRPVKVAVAPYPDSQARFVWNAKAGSFDVWLNKRPARATEGGIQHASTVVLQFVKQTDSGFGDKYGGTTPMLATVGTGKAWVLRDGRAYPVTWSRPAATGGTTFTGADGQPVAFKAGQVWVVLVNSAVKATVS